MIEYLLKKLHDPELNELLDLLVKHTQEHSQLIANGSTFERFRESEDALIKIQQQIEQRKLRGKPSCE